MNLSVFAGRRVLVTGHTGFKGSWLALWLTELGSEVHGYALPPLTPQDLYTEARVSKLLNSERLHDVRDASVLSDFVASVRPEFVFHLAAQAIVRRSYREPRETWETNVIGTINVLDAVRRCEGVGVCQVITSDKCYENPGQVCAFRETDPMGGHDPYSSSKGAAELAVSAWRRSYFGEVGATSVATARAGNVIGGGDWAEDRIIPDCIRALSRNEPIAVRNPHAVRPWQHVLEPLSGYLTLAARQWDDRSGFADGYNFGPYPSGNLTVGDVAEMVVQRWGGGQWRHTPPAGKVEPRDRLHEASFLKLDITKATTLLNWTPVFTPVEAITETVSWYRRRHVEGGNFDARRSCLEQIRAYFQRQN